MDPNSVEDAEGAEDAARAAQSRVEHRGSKPAVRDAHAVIELLARRVDEGDATRLGFDELQA
jgi:hypothetical protein